eukprot:CAMPEP_0176225332 /NCGR_PEP_ID=MMETSP0121_2-20121125/21707_1 /TAXON_ID=160619 /ORGANISM="Kryptoperidinium foliaceum, Strain CCMP 1326" /LENGTH=75 /DNA_ID=CAMNT_0017564597 /DNA_START=30 /DNA_END=253 /DNA_ORIENTATION=+
MRVYRQADTQDDALGIESRPHAAGALASPPATLAERPARARTARAKCSADGAARASGAHALASGYGRGVYRRSAS